MEEPVVTPQGAQPPLATDKVQDGKGKEQEFTRAEFESLRRERDEARESEKFWATRARSGDQQQTDEEPEQINTADLVPEITGDSTVDEAIFNDPDKWADAISKGPAAIKAFVKTMGLITGAEAADIAAKVARRTVDIERQKITSDNIVLRDFKELADPTSDLFKATAVVLKQLVAMDPNARKSPATLYAAAKAAKAELDAKKPARRAAADADDDDDRYDRPEQEDDRRRRSDAQDGTRNKGRDAVDDMDMLGPEAKEVIRAMGITQEEFSASAKETRGQRPRGRR